MFQPSIYLLIFFCGGMDSACVCFCYLLRELYYNLICGLPFLVKMEQLVHYPPSWTKKLDKIYKTKPLQTLDITRWRTVIFEHKKQRGEPYYCSCFCLEETSRPWWEGGETQAELSSGPELKRQRWEPREVEVARVQCFMNFQKADKEGTISRSFHESSLTLIPKPNKGATRKGNYRLCLSNTDVKILNITK